MAGSASVGSVWPPNAMSFLTQAGLWLDDDPLGIPQPRDLLSPRQRLGVGHLFAEVQEVVLCGDRAGDQREAPV